VNTRIGLATRGYEVTYWIRNLTDKKYVAYAYDFGGAHLGNPKNVGVTIRKSF
jgi:iron complex outermembrane receptor protein